MLNGMKVSCKRSSFSTFTQYTNLHTMSTDTAPKTINVRKHKHPPEEGPLCGEALQVSQDEGQKYEKALRNHIERCMKCPSIKRSRVDLPVVEIASLQLSEELERILGRMRLNVSVTGMTRTEIGALRCETRVEVVKEWPVLVDPSTHVEWDDTDLGIEGLFNDLEESPGLQQKWTLLLKDVVLCHRTRTVQCCVVETYDRNHRRDSFAERQDTKAISSAPSGDHCYERIKVSSRPAMSGGSSVIIVGTEMNAIFTNVALKDEKDSHEVGIGQSAGAGSFEPSPTTRVFLSKYSIEAAQKHRGTRFAEAVVPPLAQLPGIFSHFHHKSAYFSARAGQAGKSPATVFTLPDFRLFAVIASAMMKDPTTAVLNRGDVEEAMSRSCHDLDKVLRKLAKSVRPLVRESNVKLLSTDAAAAAMVIAEEATLYTFIASTRFNSFQE